MAQFQLQTGAGVFDVLAHVCRSPLEALKQFVENAADAIEQAGNGQGRVVVCLETGGEGGTSFLESITVEDNGVGLSREKMEQVLAHVGDSEKAHSVLRGEKGIGLLAFALIADEVHLSSNDGSGPSGCLVLKRDALTDGVARIEEHCPLHSQSRRGTKVHLLRVRQPLATLFTRARLREYFGREFGHDLKQGQYTLVLRDGHHSEMVSASPSRGISIFSSSVPLDSLGQVSVQLYALPVEMPEAAVCLYGRGGTRICNLTDLEAFQKEPWRDHRLEGSIHCDQLKRSADKTAVVHDEALEALIQSLGKLEPYLSDRVHQVTQEYRQQRMMEVIEKVDRFIARFLRHADDDRFFQPVVHAPVLEGRRPNHNGHGNSASPHRHNGKDGEHVVSAPRERPHLLRVDLCAPSGNGSVPLRSWSEDGQTIHINELHRDFLRSQWDDKRWAWYLFTLWAKEKALSEHSSDPAELADQMAGILGCAGPLMNQYLQRA